MSANFKRRLWTYVSSGKEIFHSLMPFILPMFYIIAMLLVLNTLVNKELIELETKNLILNMVFPILVTFGIIIASGVYVLNPV